MEQKIVTFSKFLTSENNYSFSLSKEIKELNLEGWVVKQITSTSFTSKPQFAADKSNMVAVTVLLER